MFHILSLSKTALNVNTPEILVMVVTAPHLRHAAHRALSAALAIHPARCPRRLLPILAILELKRHPLGIHEVLHVLVCDMIKPITVPFFMSRRLRLQATCKHQSHFATHSMLMGQSQSLASRTAKRTSRIPRSLLHDAHSRVIKSKGLFLRHRGGCRASPHDVLRSTQMLKITVGAGNRELQRPCGSCFCKPCSNLLSYNFAFVY